MLLHDCNPRTRFVIESHTTTEQQETEEECLPFFVHIPSLPRNQINHLRQVGLLSNEDDSDNFDVLLLREKHVAYLTRALNRTLPGSYVSLDASRSWIIYWTLHSLDLLNALPPVETLYNVIQTLKRCFTAERVESTNGSKRGGGGFGGGPQQMPHCATTYAAVMSLCILGGAKTCVEGAIPSYISEEALSFLKQVRRKLYQWFYSLRVSIQVASNSQSDTTTSETIGTTGFRVHRDGEVDVRGTYTVIAVCTVLDIITDELMQGVAEYG
jgi:protein farnesyltransferase subunit beta